MIPKWRPRDATLNDERASTSVSRSIIRVQSVQPSSVWCAQSTRGYSTGRQHHLSRVPHARDPVRAEDYFLINESGTQHHLLCGATSPNPFHQSRALIQSQAQRLRWFPPWLTRRSLIVQLFMWHTTRCPLAGQLCSKTPPNINIHAISFVGFGFGAGRPDGLDRLNPGSNFTSNEGRRNRRV